MEHTDKPHPNLSLQIAIALSALLVVTGLSTSCAKNSGIRKPLPSVTAIGSASFEQASGTLLGQGFVSGNKLTTLSNGNEIFPAMLNAIRSARQTINFETYVFESGDVPAQFAQALAERARAGVEVNVILDAHGCKKAEIYHDEMKAAGVNLEIYHSIFWWDLRRYNFRTHRKLLIVDGRVGFIGGVGIADNWAGDARNPDEWRELHFRVDGPVVAQLQATFADNWFSTTDEILQGPRHFPPLASVGSSKASAFPSAPRQDEFAIELMYHLVIASAQKSLLIENAYFIPNDPLVEALRQAAQRGVKVQIIMPGEHMDQKAVQRASRKRWPELLEAGVELYEYQPTMIHTKLLIADGLFVSLGSANFDPRSLHINDEANLNVMDAGFASELTRIFREDLDNSLPVDLNRDALETAVETPAAVAQTPLESQL